MNRVFLRQKCPLVAHHGQGKVLGLWDKMTFGLFLVGASLFFAPIVLQLTPLRWVTTPSLPLGFYWETHEPIGRGSYVHFCLAEDLAAFGAARGYLRSGLCPGLYEELVKVVAAVAGDVVEIGPQGITINGQPVPDAPIYEADSQGRPQQVWITSGTYVTPDGSVFVLSTHHPRSWDSRYFGFVPISAIRGTARPWWVWP